MITAAALLMLLNIVFFHKIYDYVSPIGVVNNEQRRTPCTVFFGFNTFLYIWLEQIISASVTLPLFPSAVLSGICGYAIAMLLFPDSIEQRETLGVPEDLAGGNPLDECRQEDDRKEGLETGENADPFEKVLHQLGLNKSSRLALLDQRTIKAADSGEIVDQDILNDFFINLSVGMPGITANLLAKHRRQAEEDREHDERVPQTIQGNVEEPKSSDTLSRRDATFAILSCCDPFLLQEIMRQFVLCDSAVPVVMPARDIGPVFLLWGLGKAYIPRVSPSSSLVSSVDITTTLFVTVTAIRLGKSSVSKSEVCNNMFVSLKCSDECNPFIVEKATSVWSSGTVEAAWYLPPCDTEDSQAPLALLNLRGDSLEYPKQAKLLAGVAKFLVVFADTMKADDYRHVLQHISHDTHTIVVSQTTDMEPSLATSDVISSIDARNCSSEQISRLVLEVIRGGKVPEAERESLEDLSELCKDLKISVDEEEPECREAKETAIAIAKGLQGKSKNDIFPLQRLWKQLVGVNKEKLGEQNIEHELSDILEKKKEIRSAQGNSELSTPMKMFVRSLDTDIERNHYTYTWLEIMLQKMVDLPDSHTVALGAKEESDRGDAAAKVDHLDITKFHKELCQLAESRHPCLRQDHNNGDSSIFEYFIQLRRHGVLIVVFDSDACAVPLESLEDTLKHLDESSESDPKVYVVSVIGSPKSFKTILLNRLFGVNFSTRGQVTTKGMIMHLVPVEQPASKRIGYDYLLIIDTQSFDTADNLSPEDMERYEYITTLTLCISDLVLLNTRFSQKNVNQDARVIDSILTRGLNKMREVNKSGKCCLVQHYYRDVPVTDENVLSQELFQKAKRDLSEEIARVKGRRAKKANQDIFDVFKLDERKLVMSIPYNESDLRLGFSEENCQRVLHLRELILQVTARCSRAQMSFGDFCQRIADVTDAMKKEEFVKDFRDTNVENLKDEFVVWYRDHLLKVESNLNIRLATSCNRLGKVAIEELPAARNVATSEITQAVEEGFGNVKEKIQEQLQTRKYEYLADQREYFQQDINAVRDSLLPKIGESFDMVVKNAEKIGRLNEDFQKECDAFLATLPASVQTETPEQAVQEMYEQIQSEFQTKLLRKYPLDNLEVIHKHTEDNMMNMLKKCGDEVDALIATDALAAYVDDQEQISSIDDVKKLKNRFNVSTSPAEEAFRKVKSKLFASRENPERFKDSSKEFIHLLKSHESDFQKLVGNVMIYLFIMGKFIFEMHKSQLEKEVEELICSEEDFNDRSKLQEIGYDVNREDYKITRAEPLDVPTIDAKLSSILFELKNERTEQEMMIFKVVFTSKNIQNCASLPFDLVTLQRLDKRFLCMLPLLHSEDMNSISNAVIDAKMIMFGKVFAKQRFEQGKTFDCFHSLVQETIIDDEEYDKKVRAAALVHLSAWSTAVADVKELEDNRIDNVASTFGSKQGKIRLALFKSRIGHNCDDVIADIICDEIEHSLGALATDSIVTRLREYFLMEARVFNLKRTFIGTVLRDLCLKDDYLGFASFLKDYKEFGEKWILNFLANECNQKNDSLLKRLLEEVMDSQMNKVETVIKETTAECEGGTSPNLSNWLGIFQAKFSDQFNTSCRANTINMLNTKTSVERFDDFNARLIRGLDAMRPRLECYLSLPIEGNEGDTKAWLLSLSHEIHVELAAVVRGCIEQCPFCGAACESTLREHEFHETVLHYPGGLKGWHDDTYGTLCTGICTSAVASSREYRIPTLRDKSRHYKDYKIDHPRWEIPGKIGEPMEFWQFVFNKFNAQFARHYRCHLGDIPSQWSRITKEEAVRSVEKAYKLDPLVSDA